MIFPSQQKASSKLINQLHQAESLHLEGELQKAATLYHLILEEHPELVCTAYNLGIVLIDLQLYSEAETAFRHTLTLQPDFVEAELSLYFALQEQGYFDQAIVGYSRLLADPIASVQARFNLSCLQLLTGDFINGWNGYELRFDGLTPVSRRHSEIKLWNGVVSPGTRLLIHTEQGYGDSIQMSRYLPILSKCGMEIYIETTHPLLSLFSMIPGIKSCFERGAPTQEVDYHLPIMSLPVVLGITLENIPASVPYLKADDSRINFWKSKLPVTTDLRVGICWAGRLDLPVNRKRSVHPELMTLLLETPNVLFVSLQQNMPEDFKINDPRVVSYHEELRDFHDTAALIANLDLVITIDTSVAHLAGAIGTPTWLMLPFVPDWRWLLCRDDSPWYPSMRLFRQHELGNWKNVITSVCKELRQYVKLDNESIAQIFQSGLALINSGMFVEAADKFRAILSVEPTIAEAWHNLGHACMLYNTAEAEHAFRMARRFAPAESGIACSLASFYSRNERYEEALALFREVLQQEPENIFALSGAGHACQNLFRNREAYSFYEEMLRHDAYDIDALNNMGVLYREAGDLLSSRLCFEKILEKWPDEGDARWNLSHTLLIGGDLKNGWKEYEWRFHRTESIYLPQLDIPLWNNEPLNGTTIILWCEQAYGDTIQFIRYADTLNNLGAKVIVIAQDKHIAPLLATASGVHAVQLRDKPIPKADYWVPLLSLPYLFDTTLETIPLSVPYLTPSASTLKKWKSVIPASETLRVGIVWSGRTRPDPRRSCRVEELLKLTPVAIYCRWYSLQVDADPKQLESLKSALSLTDLAPLLTDFAETAAAICSLDLVITIDTSVAHLAGALAVPVWLLLPFAPDWRWLLERDDSPWYPSMRIFRQPSPGDWENVMSQVSDALKNASARKTASAMESPRQQRLFDQSDFARQNERWQESLNFCLAILAEMPLYSLALLKVGGCLLFLKQPLSAARFFEKTMECEAELTDAHINLGIARLTTGDYETGWKEFEWRLLKSIASLPPLPTLPASGITLKNLRGRKVLVHAEQGFGDILQFCRYTTLLAEFGLQVILSVPPNMIRLLSNLEGVAQIVPNNEKFPEADYQTFLLSLPLLLYEAFPEPVVKTSYLLPSTELTTYWGKRIPDAKSLKVGIAWAGRDMKQSGYRRALTILDYLPLLRVDGVTFVSLQIGSNSADINLVNDIDILDFSTEIKDFADTAAIISGLDLVITIDTSVAHLSAALGKPTWVALLYAPDWRWGLDGKESVWYPSISLFRQAEPGAWEPVIAEMANILKGEILIRQGHAYSFAGDRKLAIETFHEAAMLSGDTASAWLNLGVYLKADGRIAEAKNALLAAVEKSPDYPEAWQNLAQLHLAQRELPEAYSCFRNALSLRPDYPTARWNLGLLLLLLGEYSEGFKNLESRFDTIAPVPRLHQNIPRWDGSSLSGKIILIHAEQGYGDTIQFIRFLPKLAETANKVILEVQDDSLLELASSLDDSVQIIVRGEAFPSADLQLPLLSLPFLLRTNINSIPDKIPYLLADKEKIGFWRKSVAQTEKLKVGISWKGRPTPDPLRSVPFSELNPLFEIPNIAWYSLQMDRDTDATLPDNMLDLASTIIDFSDTAAILASLDLIITIDSALAHLAGSLKTQGIIMLQAVPDWRWGLDWDKTPWYPSLILARQKQPGEWSCVIEEVCGKLIEMTSK